MYSTGFCKRNSFYNLYADFLQYDELQAGNPSTSKFPLLMFTACFYNLCSNFYPLQTSSSFGIKRCQVQTKTININQVK